MYWTSHSPAQPLWDSGLMHLQSNPVQPHFNFLELIQILKAPLELQCFQKMFGLDATRLQVPCATKEKCVSEAQGIFIRLILSSVHYQLP